MSRIGRYELGEEIARGGTGAVFRATDAQGKPCAIKLLHSQNPVHLRRFFRETQALVRITHPNVIKIHDVGEARGAPYLVMDLIDGESLGDRLEREGPMPGPEAAELLLDVTRAVAWAHDVGVLHRDIKPGNILLPQRGPPILTDFGLARDLAASRSSLSKTGTFLGTPGYWPPEQAQGRLDAVGPASDVYGLGATLYAMLTGQPPFVGQSLIELLGSTVSDPPTPPSHLVEHVDRDLERVCLRCLEKDPARRYPSAEALADALEDYLAGRSTSPSRLPLLLGGVIGALLLLLAGALALRARRAAPATAATAASSAPPRATPTALPPPVGSPRPTPPPSLGLAKLVAQAEAHARAKAWAQVKAVCDRILAEDDEHLEALRLRGRARAHLGDPRGALEDTDRALAQAPRRGVLHMNRGLCQMLLGRTTKALEDFARAIRYDPSNARAHTARGLARYQLKDLRGAVEDAGNAIAADDGLVDAWILRGNAHHALGALEAAEADFTRAIALAPKNAQALHNRGMSRVGLAKFTAAVTDYTAALAADPTATYVYASRGMARERIRDDRGAVADYRAALAKLPPDSPARPQVRQLLAGALRRLQGR